jgi:hypothetical protein
MSSESTGEGRPGTGGGEGNARRDLAVASVCLAAAAVLAAVQSALVYLIGLGWGNVYMDELGPCAMLGFAFGMVALMAAYGVRVRSSFRFLAVSCIVAVFSIGFFVGSALAFVALFMVARHRNEFR